MKILGSGEPGGLMIIGERPSSADASSLKPFSGENGSIIYQLAEHFYDGPVYYTYAYKEMISKTPTKTQYSKGYSELLEEIVEIQPEKILILGSVAYATLFGTTAKPIKKTRGISFMLYGIYCRLTISEFNLAKNYEWFTDIRTDMELLCTRDAPYVPEFTMETLYNYDELDEALEWLSSGDIVSCDIETTGLEFKGNEIIAIGFATDTDDGVHIINVSRELLQHANTPGLFKTFLRDFKGRLTFHNAAFDTQHIYQYCGHDFLNNPPADTMLMSALLDERKHGRCGGKGLKDLSRIYFDAEDYAFEWDEFYAREDEEKWDELYDYLALDVLYSLELYHQFWPEIEEEGLQSSALDVMFPLAVTVGRVEAEGMRVDVEYLKELDDLWSTELVELDKRMKDAADDDEFNPNSPKQVKSFIDSLSSRVVSNTKSMTLEKLERRTKNSRLANFLDALLKYRKLSKLHGTYVVSLLEKVDEDGRIHASFWPDGTVTGRMSSSNPNLQNIPKRGDKRLRRAFIARPGFVLVEADYSQLEMRGAAYLSEDNAMVAAYKEGRDFHAETGVALFGESTSENRVHSKTFNFGAMYQRTASGIANGKEMHELWKAGKKVMTEREAKTFLNRYWNYYNGLYEFMQEQKRSALEDHLVVSEFGRKRRFPLIVREWVWKIKNQAANFPVQSFASDITMIAFCRCQKRFANSESVFLIGTVHDSILFEVQEDVMNTVLPEIKNIMEDVPLENTKGIPFDADIEYGRNWADMRTFHC